MRRGLKLLVILFFYLFIALTVIVSSSISDATVSILTYPVIILSSLLLILLLKLKVRINGFILGAAAAVITMCLVIGVLAFSGAIAIGSLKDSFIGLLIMGVALQILVSLGEELSFRASIFQGLNDELGMAPAALLSAAGFAALHIPSMSFLRIGVYSDLIATATIFFAGIVLAFLYAYGGLLNAMAFHFAWNFIEYNLFDLGSLNGAISISKPGPAYLTGGAFGPEASVVTLVAVVVLAGAIWFYYDRNRKAPGQ